MSVRCKFTCVEVRKFLGYDRRMLFAAKFNPVMANSPENKAFYDATPSGSLDLATYQEDLFTVGQEYYLDITEAVPAPPPGVGPPAPPAEDARPSRSSLEGPPIAPRPTGHNPMG